MEPDGPKTPTPMSQHQRDKEMVNFLTVSLEEEVKVKFYYAAYINDADSSKRKADRISGISNETKVLCAMLTGMGRAWLSESCRHIDYLSIELNKAGLSGEEVDSLLEKLEAKHAPKKRAAKRVRK